MAFCPKGIARLSLTRGHSSSPVAATSAWSCCQWEDPCHDCLEPLLTFRSDMGLWMAFYRAFWRLPVQNSDFPGSKKAILSQRQPEISRVYPGSFPSALRRDQNVRLHRGIRAGAKADVACIGDVVSLSSPCSLQFATETKSDHRVFAPMWFSV